MSVHWVNGDRRLPPPPIEWLASDLRRLDRQRRGGVALKSDRWLAAVERAYDERLKLACECLGVDNLGNLDDLDREMQRMLQATNGPDQPGRPSFAASRSTGIRPYRSAKHLVELIGSLIPSGHRERYLEEFHGELCELASRRASPIRQLLYGLRLLSQVRALRRALEEPPEEFD